MLLNLYRCRRFRNKVGQYLRFAIEIQKIPSLLQMWIWVEFYKSSTSPPFSQTKFQCSPFVRHNRDALPPRVVGATWDVRERTWSGGTMDAIRHHHRSHNQLHQIYTNTLLYTSATQPTPRSPAMVTLYTRYTTVVELTPDMSTLCTRHAKRLHQNPQQKTNTFHQLHQIYSAPDISTSNTVHHLHQIHQDSKADVQLQSNIVMIYTVNYFQDT